MVIVGRILIDENDFNIDKLRTVLDKSYLKQELIDFLIDSCLDNKKISDKASEFHSEMMLGKKSIGGVTVNKF